MANEAVTRWTAILTNLAVVVGLAFVGLEFRDNARTAQAERIDSLVQGSATIQTLSIENADLSEILHRSYADPQSLSPVERDRAQHWMVLNYSNFMRVHRAYLSGLLPEDLYLIEKAGVGFAFSSDVGLAVIESFRASALGNEVWDIIAESAKQAQVYCLDTENICVDRYEAGI